MLQDPQLRAEAVNAEKRQCTEALLDNAHAFRGGVSYVHQLNPDGDDSSCDRTNFIASQLTASNLTMLQPGAQPGTGAAVPQQSSKALKLAMPRSAMPSVARQPPLEFSNSTKPTQAAPSAFASQLAPTASAVPVQPPQALPNSTEPPQSVPNASASQPAPAASAVTVQDRRRKARAWAREMLTQSNPNSSIHAMSRDLGLTDLDPQPVLSSVQTHMRDWQAVRGDPWQVHGANVLTQQPQYVSSLYNACAQVHALGGEQASAMENLAADSDCQMLMSLLPGHMTHLVALMKCAPMLCKLAPVKTAFVLVNGEHDAVKPNSNGRVLVLSSEPGVPFKLKEYDQVLALTAPRPAHWGLVVLNKTKRFLQELDSSEASAHGTYQPVHITLIEWVLEQDESFASGRHSIFTWPVYKTPSTYPQQQNGHDCGIFALTAARFVAADVSMNFTAADVHHFYRPLLFMESLAGRALHVPDGAAPQALYASTKALTPKRKPPITELAQRRDQVYKQASDVFMSGTDLDRLRLEVLQAKDWNPHFKELTDYNLYRHVPSLATFNQARQLAGIPLDCDDEPMHIVTTPDGREHQVTVHQLYSVALQVLRREQPQCADHDTLECEVCTELLEHVFQADTRHELSC